MITITEHYYVRGGQLCASKRKPKNGLLSRSSKRSSIMYDSKINKNGRRATRTGAGEIERKYRFNCWSVDRVWDVMSSKAFVSLTMARTDFTTQRFLGSISPSAGRVIFLPISGTVSGTEHSLAGARTDVFPPLNFPGRARRGIRKQQGTPAINQALSKESK